VRFREIIFAQNLRSLRSDWAFHYPDTHVFACGPF
jgi:hypothetical protein